MLMITGGSGFIGRHLCARLARDGVPFRAALRSLRSAPDGVTAFAVGEIDGDTQWRPALEGARTVIHIAGLAHGAGGGSAAELLRVNVAGTASLARAAAQSGVSRFVLLSTAKVHGDEIPRGVAITEDAPLAPADPYAASKLDAENALRTISQETGMECTVVRTPLVYGAGVKANFLALLTAVSRGWPLPFGNVDNRRSLVYAGNLVDALLTCASHPAAAGQAFLVSDGIAVSTAALVREIGSALGRAPRLVPVPPPLLRLGGTLAGRRAAIDRLLGSFAVDDARIRQRLNWQPPIARAEAMSATAAWFLALDRTS
ncbi:MAG: NAD-dependent epimerase/dehydratase family protein [Gemmatimonadaceae bacterium]